MMSRNTFPEPQPDSASYRLRHGDGGILELGTVLTFTKCQFDECLRLNTKIAHKNPLFV